MSMTIEEAQRAISEETAWGVYVKVFSKGRISLDGDFYLEHIRFIADTMDKIEEKTE